jgi:hypothetical protein
MKLEDLPIDPASVWAAIAAALPGVTEQDIFEGSQTQVASDDHGVSFIPSRAHRRGYIARILLLLIILSLFIWPMVDPHAWPSPEGVFGTAVILLLFYIIARGLWRYRPRPEIRIIERGQADQASAPGATWIPLSNVAKLVVLQCPLNSQLRWCQLYVVTRSPAQSFVLFQRHPLEHQKVEETAANLAARWSVPCVTLLPQPAFPGTA